VPVGMRTVGCVGINHWRGLLGGLLDWLLVLL
jgi:hypothetical protein